jgi:two-component sensor histidine kinase
MAWATGRARSRWSCAAATTGRSPGRTGFSAAHGPDGGLGLRLVRALVEEELRGQFTLTHPAGRGSIATATIPPVERAG